MPERQFRFYKYQGLGNDFLLFDLRVEEPLPSPQHATLAQALCDRHYGVGADGVLILLPPSSDDADVRLRILNVDGSEAEMCGNGIRCVAKYLHDRDPRLRRSRISIETLAGNKTCEIATDASGAAETIKVAMGHPSCLRKDVPMTGPPEERCLEQPLEVDGATLRITALSMGNPHAVVFVPDNGGRLRDMAERYGAQIERHRWFTHRTNVEFVRLLSPAEIDAVVWERGCGITLACGTGACAACVAACLTGRLTPGSPTTVRLPGGSLSVAIEPDYSGVTMTGPAVLVFEASIDLPRLATTASSQ
ncbi:MAG: diaminopimelate epimerase [Pseudomonadota bacterium]